MKSLHNVKVANYSWFGFLCAINFLETTQGEAKVWIRTTSSPDQNQQKKDKKINSIAFKFMTQIIMD